MSLRINQNISALTAHRWLQSNDVAMSKAIERLSSGFRINSAADDAAGLVISENLRTQVSGLTQAMKNTQDGINMIKTAEKALDEIEVQLRNVRDLVLHAANNKDNIALKAADQAQVDQALDSIDRISDQTEFAGQKLLSTTNLNGRFFQIGANEGQTATFSLSATFNSVSLSADMHVSELGLGGAGSAPQVTGTREYDSTKADTLTVVTRNADGTLAQDTFNIAAATTLADAITAINTGIDADYEAVETDASGNVVAGGGYLTIRGKAAGAQEDDDATVQVFSTHADQGAGFTQAAFSQGQATTTALDLTTTSTAAGFDALISALDDAMTMVEGYRVSLGSFQKNNLESNLSSVAVAKENISASESAIRDTDMASEMVSFTRAQILMQAGQAMMAQANQAPQSILQMLR